MGIFSIIWASKPLRYLALAAIAFGLAFAFVAQQRAAAVEQARLEREIADLEAREKERERRMAVIEAALEREEARRRDREAELERMTGEINGLRTDVEAGAIPACPATPAYDDRLRAIWGDRG